MVRAEAAIDLGALAPMLGSTCRDYLKVYSDRLESSILQGEGGIAQSRLRAAVLDGLLSALFCAADAAAHGRRPDVSLALASATYVLNWLAYTGEVVDLTETVFYHRLKHAVTAVSQAIRARSTGRIHGYIGYVLVTLVMVLLLFGKG